MISLTDTHRLAALNNDQEGVESGEVARHGQAEAGLQVEHQEAGNTNTWMSSSS